MAGITRWLISGLVVLGGYVAFCQEPEDSPDSEDVAASKVVLESSLPVTHSAFSSRTLKKSSRLARPKTGGGAAIGAEQLTVLQRHDTSNNTLIKNMALEAEAKRLRIESDALEKALKRAAERIMELEIKHGGSSALALIDGDGYVFSPGYWRKGKEGGRQAAVVLHDTLAATAGLRSQLCATIYFNRKGLGSTLCANSICSKDQFEDFIVGFNQSTPLFAMIDAGHGKEAADAKIRGTLNFFAHLPQTKLILFGGGHDRGYLTELSALRTEGLLHKLALLKGSRKLAHGFESLPIPVIPIEGLFLESNLSPSYWTTPREGRPSASLPLSPRAISTSNPPYATPIYSINSERGQGSVTDWTGSATPSGLDLSYFVPLIDALVQLKEVGQDQPIRSVVVEKIGTRRILELYKEAGVDSFKAYANLAEATGLVINMADRIALANLEGI